jgi:hypothetical protein
LGECFSGEPNRASERAGGPGAKPPDQYWCGREDSNLHEIAPASPSSWCVCQFRHFRKWCEPEALASEIVFYLPGVAGGVFVAVGFGDAAGEAAGAAALGEADGAGDWLAAGVVDVGVGDPLTGGAAIGSCAGPCTPLMTELLLRPTTPSPKAPSMNSVARTVVALVRKVAPARAPNAVWLLDPPNAAAMSPPLPCWSRTTTRRRKQISTYSPTST